jgi:hypothetical protein
MKPFPSTLREISTRPDILSARYRFGLVLGICAGLAFAAATWGLDAMLLNNAHAYQPWLKWIVGALVCAPVGGLAGWLSARLDRPLFSVLLWLAASGLFAWLSAVNAFQIYPALIVQMDPEFASFIDYTAFRDLGSYTVLAYIWTGIFGLLVGALQLALSEGAVFSASYGSRVMPVLVVMLIMGLCGTILDNLNNEPLRSPIGALHQVVQFASETRGQKLDPKLALAMRRSTVKAIEDWLGRPYYFVIASFDNEFGQVHVYANFGGDWADCTVFYDQPSFCKPLSP